MAMLGIYGALFPDHQIALIFAPMYPFSADTGIKGMGILDTIGKEYFQIVAKKDLLLNETFHQVEILLLF